MNEAVAQFVRDRGGARCEYCRLPASLNRTPFELEHIIAIQHGGSAVVENLAISCLRCNRHKGPNIASIDWQTSRTRLVRLFNPRRHSWPYHFRWNGAFILGRTRIGRVTVKLLDMNDPMRVALRESLIDEGLFPADE